MWQIVKENSMNGEEGPHLEESTKLYRENGKWDSPAANKKVSMTERSFPSSTQTKQGREEKEGEEGGATFAKRGGKRVGLAPTLSIVSPFPSTQRE